MVEALLDIAVEGRTYKGQQDHFCLPTVYCTNITAVSTVEIF